MPKRLRSEPIYLAPDILAWRDDDYRPCIIDQRNGRMLNPYSVDDKIFIYERQVQEWFINRAKSLIARKQNNFVVLMIAVAYIEGNEQYRRGQSSDRKSKRFFRYGFQRIFHIPESESNNIDRLYEHLRCGLFHNGMSGDAIVLNRKLSTAIVFSAGGTIDINPRLFLAEVVEDFNVYLEELRDVNNESLRSNFNTMFEVV